MPGGLNKFVVKGKEAEVSTSVVGQANAEKAHGLIGFFRNPYVFWSASFASLGCLMYGYDQGVMGPILVMENFEAHFTKFDGDSGSKWQSWMVAALELGAWIGALIAGWMCDKISRKHTMHVAVFIFTLGTGLQTGAQSPAYMYGGRIVGGLGIGMFSMVIPLYQAEISPPELRGSLVSLQQLSITIGSLISFWLDYGFHFIGGSSCKPEGQPENYTHSLANGTTVTFDPFAAHGHHCTGEKTVSWRVPLALQIIPAWILFVGMWFLPYSPRYLVLKGKDDESKKVLAKLRQSNVDDPLIIAEYLEIKSSVMFDNAVKAQSLSNGFLAPWKELLTPNILRRVMIGVWTMIFQQFTGINAVMYYAPQIFSSFGFSSVTTTLLATGVTGILQVCFTLPTVLFLDKFGRRTFMITGAIGMAICHIVIAIVDGIYEDKWALNQGLYKGQGWVSVVFIWLFAVNFAYSWGPVAWVLIQEIFPSSFRARGVSIAASTNWMFNFIIGVTTKLMIQNMKFGTYIFFAAFCIGGALFMYFLVPETKNKTLEELDVYFGGSEDSIAERDRELMRSIQEELGIFTNYDRVVQEKEQDIEHHESPRQATPPTTES